MIKYVTANQIDNFTFLQVPISLYEQKIYPREILSLGAIHVYILLRSRMTLSRANGWIDKDTNRIFFYYEQEELAWKLGVSRKSIYTYLKELENCHLVEQVTRGRNRAKVLYLGDVQIPNEGTGMSEWAEEKKRREAGKSEKMEKLKNAKSPTAPRTGKIYSSENEEPENPGKSRTSKIYSSEEQNIQTGDPSPTETRTGKIYSSENGEFDGKNLPISYIEYRDIKDIKDLKELKDKEIKDMPQGGQSKQQTLINLPTKENKSAPLSKMELAEKRISEARTTGKWEKVTNENFTYYYQAKHNLLLSPITINPYTDVTLVKTFIQRYALPKEKVCEYIDHILGQYVDHPRKYNNMLTYNMLDRQTSLVNDLMRRAEHSLKPLERKYPTNTFSNKMNALKTAPMDSFGDMEVF